ncbi:MAG: cell division protein FtsB [Marinobacterium sp.]|nr:cell division protein FtsB [Marinobacterium sp.]
MYRALVVVLIILLSALQYRFWAGEPNLYQNWQLQSRIEQQRQENERLSERNERLNAEVLDLKNGLLALEERARSDLGMIRKGETFYQLVGPAREDQ